jgi:tetratricopeptide (TPR) repeat protein
LPKDLPPPFRIPKHQPPPSIPLPTLLYNHNFRSAATSAAVRLTTPPAPPPSELFSLIYTRLACLTLINHLPFAAEESKALQDINSPFYKDEISAKSILPWDLRVLAVRLQGIGYGDARRGVGGYYDLAKEARGEARSASGVEKKKLWQERLQELGTCVANALIEMGDLGAAVRHLESLRPREGRDQVLEGRLALLYVNLGDIDAARRCLDGDASEGSPNKELRPLLSMAEGRYADAVGEWRALPESDVATQNLAVCLFYTGKVEETLELLDGLVEKGRNFHALTFNLATVYELCSDKGREKKGDLVARIANTIEENGGGERGVIDFKIKL